MTADYKDTLFLPSTDFPMKAALPKREPGMLERWQGLDMYKRLRETAAGREKFILHDGPPYANGHLHIGTALNKILKDVITRSRQMTGYDSNYVPGWDCHGLPIEWQVEESYRKKGKSKDEVPVTQIRSDCRAFAEKWLDIQRQEFERLGLFGDWRDPYTTMAFPSEARIVEELLKFLMKGSLYKGAKPVMWSVVEKTALAEAEVEYQDHTSTTIDVRFPVTSSNVEALDGASIVIWTTTPWTIPGNRAVCFGPNMDYRVIEVRAVAEDSLARVGEKLVVSAGLLEEMCERAGITEHAEIARLKGKEFDGTVCAHPWRGQGYDFDVPLLPGSHVSDETGTGFVHTAPGHGAEDYEIGLEFDLPSPETVGGGGIFVDSVPLLAGCHVFKADPKVVEHLEEAGALLVSGKVSHSYPHSWRSKAPLIFRNTPQWFISMERTGLRKTALEAVDKVRWVPSVSKNRIRAMVEDRPDWVVSRQRAWGVPITVFEHKETGNPLTDEAVNGRIVEAVRAEGADAWFTSAPERFLGPDHDPADYVQVMDILDVWFDSGCTHSFVLETRDDLAWPADLYLEGTDQHRGWFQSSLMESCGTRGAAPFKAVLTHGFVLAEDGRKMSKSLGNIVSPEDVIRDSGADILRLWAVSSQYTEDLRIGPDVLQTSVDAYRRIRNTFRFMLGNLAGFDEAERLASKEMPELERWLLHRLAELDGQMRRYVEDYDFSRMFSALYNFCTVDLSAFYFDVRKDSLYCDALMSNRRRAARTVLDRLFHCLTAWFAPLLCFTAEEVWLTRFPSDDGSVHLEQFPDIPGDWRDDALAGKWSDIRTLRRVVTGALEVERREKRIGASLQAAPKVYVEDHAYVEALDRIDLAELAITSVAEIIEGKPAGEAFSLEDVPGIRVVSELAAGEKCERCWRVLTEVGETADHPGLCRRCAEVV